MVYEGQRRSTSRRKKSGGGAKTGFLALLWCLLIVVAVAVVFPDTAARIREKLGDAVGVNIEGAMEVFSREAKEKNVFHATREAFKYAFSPDDTGQVEALAGEDAVNSDDPGGEVGGISGAFANGEEQATGESFDDLSAPDSARFDNPREDLVLAGPMAGEVVRGFGYTAGDNGEPVFHYGIDVQGEAQSSVRCVADGTVAAVGESTVFGTYVIVTHEDSVESLYAMLGATPLSQGQTVEAGQAVGTLSGDILHMELLIDGYYVNPQRYVYRNETQ